MTVEIKKMWVTINTQFEGMHHWEDALEEVEFLRFPHRHIFHVNIKLLVDEYDRDIEIILCKRFIDKLLQELKPTIALEGWSCERIAIQLANDLLAKYDSKEVKVEVLEDGENGGGCYASKG